MSWLESTAATRRRKSCCHDNTVDLRPPPVEPHKEIELEGDFEEFCLLHQMSRIYALFNEYGIKEEILRDIGKISIELLTQSRVVLKYQCESDRT